MVDVVELVLVVGVAWAFTAVKSVPVTRATAPAAMVGSATSWAGVARWRLTRSAAASPPVP